jgi:hypothetical protein
MVLRSSGAHARGVASTGQPGRAEEHRCSRAPALMPRDPEAFSSDRKTFLVCEWTLSHGKKKNTKKKTSSHRAARARRARLPGDVESRTRGGSLGASTTPPRRRGGKKRGIGGIEPPTSSTRRTNHATRPNPQPGTFRFEGTGVATQIWCWNKPQFPGMILVAHRSMGGVSAHCDRKMTAGRNDGYK